MKIIANIKQKLIMKQITILGGSGFLGSVLSDLLVRRKDCKVIILDNKKKTPLLKNQNLLMEVF